jgi:hypothetical protein
MNRNNLSARALALAFILAVSWLVNAADQGTVPKNLYFGETHVHTAYSLDAYLGGTRMTPADAYRHAKGQTVVVNGQPHRIRRPLDFAAVTDHAEYLGEMYAALHPDAPGHDQPEIQQLIALTDPRDRREWFLKYVVSNNRGASPRHLPFYPGEAAVASGWQVVVAASEEHNEPGVFTTFPAFEWSSAPGGANLHRNIIYRSATVPAIPMSSLDIPREEALWAWLAEHAAKGSRALALPHNSNASKGLMFPDKDSTGKPLDAAYALQRAEFERAIEIMQIKGNSEVNPGFWSADEFADFENAPSMGQFSGRTPDRRNYVRDGLVRGLALADELGTNPFKLGIIGGTDSHNALMGDTDEDNWVGGHGFEDGTPQRRQTAEVGGWLAARDQSPGSLTGAWAVENTREAIWDALYNREVFATSGSRIALRFFAGWTLEPDMLQRADRIERAYAAGVPMGGDLKGAPSGSAPRFLVMASKDAVGANLDRIQIVKGWVDADGSHRDKVFDVVWSGARIMGADGKLPSVGNTVDLKTATYLNTIGAATLAAFWEDPEFDPLRPALYYARVLEIPTPRWTTFDAVRAGLEAPDDAPPVIQERAWSSPIWYEVKKSKPVR